MKLQKKFSFILICLLLCISISILLLSHSYSIDNIDKVNNISSRINLLNEILEKEKDITNPFYISEIVDENGDVPAYKYYSNNNLIDSRSIKELRAYDNKIFMGVGDWNANTGPVKVIYYDTITEKIESSGTISDEAIQSFKIMNDVLYTTGTDPRENWGYGSYYTYNKDNNNWAKHRFADGWVHIFDIEDYNGNMFLCGSVTDSTKTPIQVSYDKGETFQNVKIKMGDEDVPYNEKLRFYAFEEYNNNLYASLYFSEYEHKYTGLYKYDEENNQFNKLYLLPYKKAEYGLNKSLTYNYIYMTNNTTFKDNFIYVTGIYMYKVKDLDNKNSFERIDMGTQDVVQDVVVHDDTLYTLSYKYNEDKSFTTRVYSTKDLITFELLYEFIIDTLPFSIEYHNNKIYISTIYNTLSKDYEDYSNSVKTKSESGSLYKIDLDKFQNKLILDEENNTINITKDATTYPVIYDIKDDKSIFKTTLTFKKNMTKKEWEQEYSKFKNLNLLYTLVENPAKIDYQSSIVYFDSVLNQNITNITDDYDNALEFAKVVFFENEEIVGDRFKISIQKINLTDEEYSLDISLVVNEVNVKINSDKYIINETESYIYIGNDNNLETIYANINYSNEIELNIDLIGNKLKVLYEENNIKEYDIIRFITEQKIIDNNIFVGSLTDEQILNDINLINGKIKLEDNKLKFLKQDIVLDEYYLIRIISTKFDIIENKYLYIADNKITDIENNINIINANWKIENNKLEILKDETLIVSFEVLRDNFDLSLNVSNNIIFYSEDILKNDITTEEESINITIDKAGNLKEIEGDIGVQKLNYGINTFNIKVINEFGKEKNYILNVTRTDNRSNNNNLLSLIINNTKIQLLDNEFTYKIVVNNSVNSAKIDAILSDDKSNFVTNYGPREVNLNIGENIVEIKVESERNEIKTYTINILREENSNINDENAPDKPLEEGPQTGYSIYVLLLILIAIIGLIILHIVKNKKNIHRI